VDRDFRPALHHALRVVFVITAFSAAFASSGGQPQAVHFSPDAAALYQSVSQITPPADADVQVLEDEDTFVFDAEGRAIHTQYLLYKVLTQRGAEGWSDVSLHWDPWHQDRPTLRARVITPDSAVHPLDAGTITDAPAKENEDNVFSDRHVIRAPLPAIAPGSLVEEELTSTESSLFPGAGILQRDYFGRPAPVRHTLLVLDAPSALPLRYSLQLLPDVQPQRAESDGRVHITFDHGPLDPDYDAEAYLPSDVPAYPNVIFSTGNSWQDLAAEYGKIVDRQIASADLKSLVARIIAGKNSRDEKTSAILQYLDREVRYTGVEFGDAAVVPRSPTETLTRKYGDCKDKAALLVAMLRTANIPSYIALLNAGQRQDVAPDLPGMGMFDHAIVFVPGPPDLWIDATDEYARLGELPAPDQERLALVARPATTALLRTPATSSADNSLVEKRDVFLAENGPARIVETSQPHGSIESSYRRFYADRQNQHIKDDLTTYVKSQYLAEKLDRLDRSDPTDFSRQFELILESNKARRGFTDLNTAVAAIRLDTLFARLPSELQQRESEDDPKADAGKKPKKKRTEDYQLNDAFVTEWQYHIVPPVGFKPKPLPKNATLSLGPATLTEEFSSAKNDAVDATIRFDSVKRRITASEATEMRNQIAQLRASEPVLIYFEPFASALLREGKVREALDSYRSLIALHPNEAVHHLQIAETLLAAGMGEAARVEARSAVKLEPNSALAEKTLADILEYDSVGRKLRPGSDYAGAEAAFRSAVTLDSDDKSTVANLAILLEYNHEGLRYGRGANLKEAAALYRSLSPEKISEFGLQNNLAFALFYAGEFSEAGKAAEIINPLPIGLIVACEAALNGSAAGLADARKRTAAENQFKQIAKTAGDMLVNLRKYSLAADLEEAGASGDSASETAAFASLYRKTQPHEQLLFPDDPSGTALHFEVLTHDPNLTLDQFQAASSRNGKTGMAVQETLDLLLKEEKGILSSNARNGVFPDVGLDLSLARAQPKTQGDDASGYKVTFWSSATYKSARYVVKEDGHYRVLATTRFPAPIGLEVLDRISAGDLPGARLLLDWLREDWHLAGGDDPLAGAAFPRLWTKGKDADAATMKLAAASILTAYKPTAAQGLVILEAAGDSAPSGTEKQNTLLALLDGHLHLDQYEKALAVSADLAKQYPESRRAFLAESFTLRALGRFDEAEALAADRSRLLSGDVDAMRALEYSAMDRGDYIKTHALTQKIIDEGKAQPEDLNAIAWISLFAPKVDPSDVEAALKATQLSNNNTSFSHTLGCLYAELGKTKEAREVLVQSMDSLRLDEPDPNYWYAFGRIAEQYGERDVAITDYNRVTKPKRPIEIPDSTYRLAQLRLQALHAAPNQPADSKKKD
jgi:transglutaminase-like putative cysteine protease/Flp pilus assembly protein TadD